jgi:hypothetical protein
MNPASIFLVKKKQRRGDFVARREAERLGGGVLLQSHASAAPLGHRAAAASNIAAARLRRSAIAPERDDMSIRQRAPQAAAPLGTVKA